MLILKEFFEYSDNSNLGVHKKIANEPISRFSRTQYSNIPIVSEANWLVVSVSNG